MQRLRSVRCEICNFTKTIIGKRHKRSEKTNWQFHGNLYFNFWLWFLSSATAQLLESSHSRKRIVLRWIRHAQGGILIPCILNKIHQAVHHFLWSCANDWDEIYWKIIDFSDIQFSIVSENFFVTKPTWIPDETSKSTRSVPGVNQVSNTEKNSLKIN